MSILVKPIKSKMNDSDMNLTMLISHVGRTIFLSLLTASLGSLFLVSPSVASGNTGQQEHVYRRCADLQKHLNDNNPQHKHEGFEKAEMNRLSYTGLHTYTVYCNGGILTTQEPEGIMVCRGYIAYSYARVVGRDGYYAYWGVTDGRQPGQPNYAVQGRYCRWKEKFPPIYSQ